MPKEYDDGSIMSDIEELGDMIHNFSNKVSPAIAGGLTNVKIGSLASMDSGTSAENMHVPGNLTVGQDIKINGHIQADEITIDVRKIILNMDYGYIEEVFSKVQLHQLDQLLSHLNDLKLMIEKEKFGRS
jgi:hypothetical protein